MWVHLDRYQSIGHSAVKQYFGSITTFIKALLSARLQDIMRLKSETLGSRTQWVVSRMAYNDVDSAMHINIRWSSCSYTFVLSLDFFSEKFLVKTLKFWHYWQNYYTLFYKMRISIISNNTLAIVTTPIYHTIHYNSWCSSK